MLRVVWCLQPKGRQNLDTHTHAPPLPPHHDPLCVCVHPLCVCVSVHAWPPALSLSLSLSLSLCPPGSLSPARDITNWFCYQTMESVIQGRQWGAVHQSGSGIVTGVSGGVGEGGACALPWVILSQGSNISLAPISTTTGKNRSECPSWNYLQCTKNNYEASTNSFCQCQLITKTLIF